MPFFLSSKPARKPAARPKLVVKDKTKAPVAAPSPYGPAVLWLCLGLAVGGALGTGWYFARRALRNQLAALAQIPVGKGAVVLTPKPAWMSSEKFNLIVEDMERCLTDAKDPLDGEKLALVVNVLNNHQAVDADHTPHVHRNESGLVQCDVKWREAACIVVGKNGKPLSVIDINGFLLEEDASETDAQNLLLPRIEGVDTPSPFGHQQWQSERLQAGLAMLRQLAPDDRRGIALVRVGELDTQKRLKISFVVKTPQGPLDITWGLPVGEEAGIDAPAEAKRQALYVLCRNPSVQNGQAGSSFSIRTGKVMVVDIAPPAKASNTRKP